MTAGLLFQYNYKATYLETRPQGFTVLVLYTLFCHKQHCKLSQLYYDALTYILYTVLCNTMGSDETRNGTEWGARQV